MIDNEYATDLFVKTLYNCSVSKVEKNKHLNEYRNFKLKFKEKVLKCLNDRISKGRYEFSIKNNTKFNLETDLTITEDDVDLQNRGKGRQCFIKTEFALQKNEDELDIILLEEPENHLSHINMLKLIERLNESQNKQLFIATHNNLISARLDLRNSILLNSSSEKPIVLEELSEETAKFFVKSSYNNILEFILSSRVILVEGDTEYILLEKFFELETGEKPNLSDIHIISAGGKRFKRYMEVANLLKIKTAVITDNDKDYQNKCVDNYTSYNSENVKVFYETDNDIYTFEISLYNNNKEICDEIFREKLKKNKDVKQYILNNKTECALELLDKKGDELTVPEYIKESIKWLREN
jgi:predicted ATP-dependent endonuclease of OLD family